jgi:phage recombination protein Bet
MSAFVPLFEVLHEAVLLPRLPHAANGIARVADGQALLDLHAAAAQFDIPPELLEAAYLSFCSDVAGDLPGAQVLPVSSRESDDARRVLRQVKFGHLPDDYFDLFLAECRARQLSPWGRHLWADVSIDDMRGRGRRELVMGFTIDGFRAQAEVHPDYAGQGKIRWCDSAGNWTDVWLDDQPPAAAQATVHRRGFLEPMVRVATFKDYAPFAPPIGPRGKKILPDRWQRSPAGQLGRVAEAIALRAAFPEKFAKMYAPEELDRSRNAPKPTAPQWEPEGETRGQGDAEKADESPAVDELTPHNEMGFALAIVREAEVGGKQVPSIITHYERLHPGLHESSPRGFYAHVLADLRQRRLAGQQIPPATDTA